MDLRHPAGVITFIEESYMKRNISSDDAEKLVGFIHISDLTHQRAD